LLGLSALAAACFHTDPAAETPVQRELAALRQDIVAVNLTLDSVKARTERQIQEVGREIGKRSQEEGRGRAALLAQLQELMTEVRLAQGRLEESARSMIETSRRVDRLGERVEEAMSRVASLGTQMVSLEGQIQAQQERVDQLARAPAGPPAAPGTPAPGGAAEAPAVRPRPGVPGDRTEDVRLAPESADQVYRAALTDFTRQNFDQAVRGFQVFVHTFPQDGRVPDAQYWLAESYRGQGSYAQAAKEFEAFVRKYPDSPKIATAHVRHGESLILSGDKHGCAVLQGARTQFPRARAGALAKDLLAQHCS
jgi:tol-pal system protein YbgF